MHSALSHETPLTNRCLLRSRRMVDSASDARQLVRIVVDDTKLPRFIRREASHLESLAIASPDLVWRRLEELRQKMLPDLPLAVPTVDYARCVSVDVFWRHNLSTAQQDYFQTAKDYRRYLETMSDPASAALGDLSGGILVPDAHSWLIPADRIGGLDGAKTKARLQLDHDPPYIVMVFPVASMRAAGVEIRRPRGINVIPERFLQWSPGDVPDEQIDGDIPRTALGKLEWRP